MCESAFASVSHSGRHEEERRVQARVLSAQNPSGQRTEDRSALVERRSLSTTVKNRNRGWLTKARVHRILV